jgi:DNA modification methylase
MKDKIFNDDCIKILKRLNQDKDLIFDAIITDPPYNLSKKNNFDTLRQPRTGIDFGD